ncbi:hypothetical protein ABFS82_08G118900 [Erythranthe guttata]|uniref:uncharacterized protein LOC105951579 n=1 Tax=Erythranthe guttata TaxID=4155 RepID=UPI00064E0BA6|nr:PREDICTED: uncharacterized protein LOC105951579 [Erythranthe guttata]|eukprot:XP_012830489.1 PREDICTED: uncharacterized protein LOC105951579 [Erythranthe guttata]
MTLISVGHGGGGAPFPLVMVVEYLESSMSRDLLCKFPDNSAFDFDYAQSSIWSPLLPPPAADFSGRGLEVSRNLLFDETDEVGLLENTRKMAVRMKKKLTDVVLDNISLCRTMKRKKKMKKRKSFGFSPVPSSRRLSSSSPTPKAWAKVMKAAANHFKKRKKNNTNFQLI